MALMKRIMYKNYLLPPCVHRIRVLSSYIKCVHPQKHQEQIRVQISNMTPKQQSRWRDRLREYNLYAERDRQRYREQYLQKIGELPFYYDLLVRSGNMEAISIKQKKILFDRCEQAHNEFINRNRWQNVFRLPILFYDDGRWVFECENDGLSWEQLSQSSQ